MLKSFTLWSIWAAVCLKHLHTMELFLKTVFVKTQILIYFNLQNARNLIRVWIKEISSEYDMRIMGNSHEFCGSQLVTAKKLAPLCADQIELQHPPPPPPGQTPGIWLFSVPGEWGIWRIRPSRGWGIWPCLGGVEKIEPEVSGLKRFFFFFFFGRRIR